MHDSRLRSRLYLAVDQIAVHERIFEKGRHGVDVVLGHLSNVLEHKRKSLFSRQDEKKKQGKQKETNALTHKKKKNSSSSGRTTVSSAFINYTPVHCCTPNALLTQAHTDSIGFSTAVNWPKGSPKKYIYSVYIFRVQKKKITSKTNAKKSSKRLKSRKAETDPALPLEQCTKMRTSKY